MPSYFNILECGKDILNRIEVKYERACMATQEDEYLADILETIIEHNDFHKVPFVKRETLTSSNYDRGRNGRGRTRRQTKRQ